MLENRANPGATKAANFYSRKSYISFAGHVYLYGLRDHNIMRNALYERSGGLCEKCKQPLGIEWHWHHTQNTFGGRRCDGLCCALALCVECHNAEHGREF